MKILLLGLGVEERETNESKGEKEKGWVNNTRV